MNAHRQIIESKSNDLHIRVPDEFKGHRLGVIIFQADDLPAPAPDQDTVSKYAGSWSDMDDENYESFQLEISERRHAFKARREQ